MAKKAGELNIELTATTVRLQKELQAAKGELKKFSADVKTIKHIVEAALSFEGIKIGIEAIKGLSESISELAIEGEKAGSIAKAFEGLGGSNNIIEEAQKRILGLVDSFDLMSIANQGLLAQTPGFQAAFSDIADLGARLAKAMGTDVKESVENLTSAIIKGRAKALLPLGFTFTNTANKALVAKEAIEQVKGLLNNLPEITDSVDVASKALANTWDDIVKEFAIALDQNPKLTASLHELSQTLEEVDLVGFAKDLGDIAAALVNLANEILPSVITGFRGLVQMAKDAKAELSKNIAGSFKENIPGIGPLGALFDKLTGGSKQQTTGGAIKDILGEQFLKLAETNIDAIENKGTAAAGKVSNTIKNLWSAGLENGSAAAAKKIDDLNQKLRESIANDAVRQIKDNFSDALDKGNFKAAEGFLSDYKKAVIQLADEKVKDFDGADKELISKYRQGMIDDAIIPLTQEYSSRFNQATQQLGAELQKVFSGISEITQGISQTFGVEIPSGAQRAFDIFQGIASIMKGVSDTIDSINNISGIIGQITGGGGGGIIDTIVGGIGDFFGGLFAKGGIFDGPVVQRAATGKVISSPTLFTSGAGLGVMGEAGPEAILPLESSGGRLGVRVTGGSAPNQTIIHIDARGAESGVEHQIIAALRGMESRIKHETIDELTGRMYRGQFRA